MLQQIIEKMYIDPELLEELSEDQKQILFYKMRQEQLRRWKLLEEKLEGDEKNKFKKSQKSSMKKVNFLKGRDGCDWVWVMGEHPTDKSIDEILEEEAQATALRLAEAEAEVLRLKEETNFLRKAEEERQRVVRERQAKEVEMRHKKEETELYQTMKEARLAVEKMELEKKKQEEDAQKRLNEIEEQKIMAKRKSLEIAKNVRERRSSEIYTNLQEKRIELEKQALQSQEEMERAWQEQEKKAKQADLEMRNNARQARSEYRESLRRSIMLMQAARAITGSQQVTSNSNPLVPSKKHDRATGTYSNRPHKPENREMIIKWFLAEEREKGAMLEPSSGSVSQWFHGIINRADSEKLLEDKKNGSFLIRVSERIWGYTLSYKGAGHCRHFLIDCSASGYQFFDAVSAHESLVSLVRYHKDNPITIKGQEKLLYPCGQMVDPPDYLELFQDKKI